MIIDGGTLHIFILFDKIKPNYIPQLIFETIQQCAQDDLPENNTFSIVNVDKLKKRAVVVSV